MRKVQYWRNGGMRHPDERVGGDLASLVLDDDIIAWGVVPPPGVLNQLLRSGGARGGMGPGQWWEPFEIDEAEYAELLDFLLALDVEHAFETYPTLRWFRQENGGRGRLIVDEELNRQWKLMRWISAASLYRQGGSEG